MFDILCDVWSRPGVSHSPILPFDVSALTEDNAEGEISRLHRSGLDSLYLISRGTVNEAVLDAVFAAAAKRYMLVFVDEKIITSYTSCTDATFAAYNPMMCAHTLRLSKSCETVIGVFEEIAETVYLKETGGVFTEALTVTDEISDEFEKYDVILTPLEGGVDVLSSEFGEMLLYGAYESFSERFGETYKGTLGGVVSNRLADCTLNKNLWSYDMTKEFFSLGGKALELVSLIAPADKRSRKEGERIYCKTLASRLDRTYLLPVSVWCGKKSLAFAGVVPYEFAATAPRRFTLPIYNDKLFNVHERDGKDKLLALRALADTARSEGFTGAVYLAESTDGAGLIREAAEAVTAGASLVLLSEKFGDCEHMGLSGLRPDDMKFLTRRLRRLSTLGTSCKPDVSCAVLYDDGFIPFAGAKRLPQIGYQFSFLPVSQAMERGHSYHGEFLVDKFRYTSVLIDPRVRLDVPHIKHIGEFAVHGGQMFRGGTFADFAKKHLDVTDEMRENAKNFRSYSTYKSGVLFRYFINIADETTRLVLSDLPQGTIYRLDSVTGDKTMLPVTDGKINLRVLPGEDVVLAFVTDSDMEISKLPDSLCEVHALKNGENTVNVRFNEDRSAVIEFDSMDGHFTEITVNGKTLQRIVASPMKADVTAFVCSGENNVEIISDGNVVGAVLRITE